jgi:hypothetical protein
MPTPITPTGNTALDNILAIIQEGSIIAGLVAPLTGPLAPDVAAGAQIALALETIVQAAAMAHQQALGAPMDLSKLHQIAPL